MNKQIILFLDFLKIIFLIAAIFLLLSSFFAYFSQSLKIPVEFDRFMRIFADFFVVWKPSIVEEGFDNQVISYFLNGIFYLVAHFLTEYLQRKIYEGRYSTEEPKRQ